MLKKYFIMAITAIFALVACSEKFDEPGIQPAGSDNVHTLSVGIEAGTYTPAEGETKASMEAVIRVNWTKDDEVSVVNATKGKILGGSLKAKESGTSVTFEGTVTGTIDQNDKLYYIYPKLPQNENEEDFGQTGYGVSLAGQTYDGDNPGKVSFFGYAEDVAGTGTISKKIQFNLVTAYANLNMSNLPAKGAPLTSIDISNVNEGFTWKLSNKNLSAEPYVGNNGISVTCTNYNITQAGNAVARFALPASAASQQGRVITVNKAYKNDKYTVKELEKASYHNQLYSTWENNVKVTSQGDKTKVDITTSEGSTDVAEGVIPVAEAFNNTKPTEIGIGGVGTVTFDATATAKIKSNADAESSTNVFFKVEDVTNDTDVQNKNIVYEVTMKTVDEKGVEVFADGKADGVATVVVPLGDNVESVQNVQLLNAEGQLIEGGVVDGSINFDPSSRILTFKVVHFSKYAISYTKRTQPITAVAQIGERNYESLASAIAAVQNGNTIKFLCDCMDAEGIIVPGGKNFTLDFGGHTYKVTKDLAGSTGTKNQCFQLLKGSTLVFQNGTITTSCAKLGINSYSDLIVKDVTVDMSQTSATGQVACLETCNGSISLQGNTNLKTKNDQIAVLALYWPNGGYGDINVELNTTGEVKGLMAYGSYEVQDLSTVAQHSHVAIKNGKYDVTFDMDNLESYDFKIYGGVFKTSPATEYLAPNHEVVTNTDSETSASYPYKVQQKPPVVKIGGVEYADIADAFAAVPTDGTPTTVTLLENIGSKNGEEIVWKEYDRTFAYTVNDNQNITFDLNGKKIYAKTTVNGYTGFLLVKNGGSLTIKDSAEGGELNYLDGKDNEGGLAISSEGNLTIQSGTIENHTVCVSSAIQGAIDVHANEWGTSYTHHVTFKMDGGVLKSQNDNTLRIYDSSQTGKGTVVFDFEINGGEIYGADAVFIMTQWTKTYCTGDTYMNNINASVKGGKFVTKNGIRVVGNVGEDNNKDYYAIKINVSGGDFTILSSKESKHRVNNVAFQETAKWTSKEESTAHLRSYTEVIWTASEPKYETPAQQ